MENVGINPKTVSRWVKKYQEEGEAGLEPKKKPGNPLARYERRKELTYEEQLQYKIALLERELIKKEAEVARLKQLNARKTNYKKSSCNSGMIRRKFLPQEWHVNQSVVKGALKKEYSRGDYAAGL